MPSVEDRLAALEGTLGTLIANLLEPALSGPYLAFGGGVSFLDNQGIAIRAPFDQVDDRTPRLYFVPEFGADAPWANGQPVAYFAGAATSTGVGGSNRSHWRVEGRSSDNNGHRSFIVGTSVDTADSAQIQLTAQVGIAQNATVYVACDGDGNRFITNVPIDLGNRAIDDDPASPLDGWVWYRTDTDKMRLQANGATVNILTDGDTNWIDLTDGGATTLHTHAGGAGVTVTTVEVDIGSTPVTRGKFTITDAGISGTSVVLCWQAPGPYTGKGSRADEAEMQPVSVIAVEPGAGSAVVKWETPPIVTYSYAVQPGKRNTVGATFDRLDNQRWPAVMLAARIGRVRGNVKFSYIVL